MLCYFAFFFCQVRYKLGLSDDEDDEIDSAYQPRSDQDLCHPLCQCDKCSKWQKVCYVTARHVKYQLVKKYAGDYSLFFIIIISLSFFYLWKRFLSI